MEQKPTIEQVAWVFKHLLDHLNEGGSYRYLIYDRMGFSARAYQPLYSAGAFAVSNAFAYMEDYHKIMELQEKVIKQYEDTLRFLNKVCFDCVEHQRKLQKDGSDKYNFELMDFAWGTNDCIVDLPQVRKLKEEIDNIRTGWL